MIILAVRVHGNALSVFKNVFVAFIFLTPRSYDRRGKFPEYIELTSASVEIGNDRIRFCVKTQMKAMESVTMWRVHIVIAPPFKNALVSFEEKTRGITNGSCISDIKSRCVGCTNLAFGSSLSVPYNNTACSCCKKYKHIIKLTYTNNDGANCSVIW